MVVSGAAFRERLKVSMQRRLLIQKESEPLFICARIFYNDERARAKGVTYGQSHDGKNDSRSI
jgi:hypothetical protein